MASQGFLSSFFKPNELQKTAEDFLQLTPEKQEAYRNTLSPAQRTQLTNQLNEMQQADTSLLPEVNPIQIEKDRTKQLENQLAMMQREKEEKALKKQLASEFNNQCDEKMNKLKQQLIDDYNAKVQQIETNYNKAQGPSPFAGKTLKEKLLTWNWWFTPFNYNLRLSPAWVAFLIAIIIIITILSIVIDKKINTFENKPYDPYGTGIRFSQRRDDTGSAPTSLEERQFGSNPKISQLTSTPESPNFSEYYGIEASLKDGSVMIERENFENAALSLDELVKANKGL